jgi:hypothetical protein
MSGQQASQVLPDRHLHRRQPAARRNERSVQATPTATTPSTPATAPARAAARRSAPATPSTPRCARRTTRSSPVNATGCLEVFSTPYPETSWRVAWLHSLFGNAPAVGHGRRGGDEGQGRSDVRVIAQGGDGGTVDIGFGCLSGHVRAQRRRALHLLRQRGLHEHRRPALRRRPPARAPRPPRPSARAGQRLRPGQERAADRHGARHPVRRHRLGGRPARPRGQGRPAMSMRARATSTSRCPARSAGAPPRDTIKRRPAGGGERPLPALRGRVRRVIAPTRSANACRWRTTSSRRSASPTSSARCRPGRHRPHVIAACRPIADRNIRRFGS